MNAISDELKFTKQQESVIAAVLQGKTNREIASELSLGLQTVKAHLYNIYTRARVRNRAEFIIKMLANKNNQSLVKGVENGRGKNT